MEFYVDSAIQGNITPFLNASSQNQTLNKIANVQNYYFVYMKYTAIAYSIMITFGLPGNILCILTLSQKSLSNKARSSVCVTLSLVDSLFLIIQYMRVMSNYVYRTDVVNLSLITCKLGAFFYSFLSNMDGFMIVLMSIERLLAIYKPYSVKTLLTPLRMKCIITFITMLFLIWDGETMIR